MEEISIFTDKSIIPETDALRQAIGPSYEWWKSIRDYVFEKYPAAVEEWNYPGKKYGWSFRIKDKKRAIVYLLPREAFFKAAFVFGRKAYEEIAGSPVSNDIKKNLEEARVYAEGRGIRIAVTNAKVLEDIKRLIDIKLTY
ncbi:MAG: DUF3788 domain-containing protein [Bacteroidales bacterium]